MRNQLETVERLEVVAKCVVDDGVDDGRFAGNLIERTAMKRVEQCHDQRLGISAVRWIGEMDDEVRGRACFCARGEIIEALALQVSPKFSVIVEESIAERQRNDDSGRIVAVRPP